MDRSPMFGRRLSRPGVSAVATVFGRSDHTSAVTVFAERIVLALARRAVSERPPRPMNECAGATVVAGDAGLVERDATAAAVVADRWRGALEGHGHAGSIALGVSGGETSVPKP